MLVTVIERRSAEATSIWSTPLPKLAMSFIWSPAWAMRPESMRSVMVGTSTSAVRIGLDELLMGRRLVAHIEARVEKLAHAGLDHLGEPTCHHDERLLFRHFPLRPPASVE